MRFSLIFLLIYIFHNIIKNINKIGISATPLKCKLKESANGQIISSYNFFKLSVLMIKRTKKEMTKGIQLLSKKTGKMSEVLCKGVFIAIGHIPNTKPFHNSLTLDEAGYIVPKAGSQVKTHIPGIYVAGDCSDHIYRQAITAAGMGCQAAIETERWLAQQ